MFVRYPKLAFLSGFKSFLDFKRGDDELVEKSNEIPQAFIAKNMRKKVKIWISFERLTFAVYVHLRRAR